MRKTFLLMLALLGLLVFAFIALRVASGISDKRCASEVQAVVEEYFRAGGAASDPAALVFEWSPTGIAQTLPADVGDFIRMGGAGCDYWQGRLELYRKAYFQYATIPIRIIVTGGRITPSGGRGGGQVTVQNGSIYVTHPGVNDLRWVLKKVFLAIVLILIGTLICAAAWILGPKK